MIRVVAFERSDGIHFSISGCGIFHCGFFVVVCEVVALLFS